MPQSGPRPDALKLVAIAGSLLYPVVVFLALPVMPGIWLVALALLLAALRVATLRGRGQRRLGFAGLAAAFAVMASMSWIEAGLAAKFYPVLVSLAAAGLFGGSLIWTPTLIERIARRQDPNLDDEAIAYTRTVTWVWTIFLTANAVIAGALAAMASLTLWTLWTGLVSYLLMALLFIVEWSFRRRLIRRGATRRAA